MMAIPMQWPKLNRPSTVVMSLLLMLMRRSSCTAHRRTTPIPLREGFDHRTRQSALSGAEASFPCPACKSNRNMCEHHNWNCRLPAWRWVIPTLQQKPGRMTADHQSDMVLLSLCLSVCLSIYLPIYLQDQKLRNSARLPSCLNITTSKTKQFCETSSFFELDNIRNEAILRDFFNF